MAIRNIVGPIPEPQDLFGRADLINRCQQTLETSNLLILAPRRFGKSGVLRSLNNSERGYLVLSFDLEDVASPSKFVQRIVERVAVVPELRHLLRKLGGAFESFLDSIQERIEEADLGEGMPGIKFREKLEKTDWQNSATLLLTELEQADQPILFLFDELPEMLKKIANSEGDEVASLFMNWFRTVRLDEKDELRRHRFIIAGSTGLNYLLDNRLGCPETLNDFCRETVDPLDMELAKKMCVEVAENNKVEIDEHAIDLLLELVGQPVPYFIQLFFSAAAQDPAVNRKLNKELVQHVYDSRLRGPVCKRYFDQYRRRLQQYPPEIETTIIHLLVKVARSPTPCLSSELFEAYQASRGTDGTSIEFSELMADMECDWYLTYNESEESYSFYMNIMRDWWHRWYSHVGTKA